MRFRSKRSEPVATYAAVLDGRHLWLHVEDPDSDLALRDADSGDRVELTDDPLDLTTLTGSTYDVVAGRRQRVLAGELPDRRPSRTPLAPDGTSRYAVESDDEGFLRVVRHSEPATAVLTAIDQRGDRVHLQIEPQAGVRSGVHLLLLDTDDRLLASLPVTAHDGRLEALVGVDDLPAGHLGLIRLAVGPEDEPDGWTRIRRTNTDLADPNHAVLLPELSVDPADDPADRVRARFRWSPDALLVLRALDPEADQ